MDFLNDFKLILLDIEGTITSISFVKDKLFGYVRDNLRNYLEERFEENIVQSDIKDLLEESKVIEDGFDLKDWKKMELIRKVEEVVMCWMDGDKKYSSLKKLQGHIFQEAFESKAVVTEFFPDVLTSIRKLKKLNKQVSIYSSGSVFAQKLLFSHTTEGDITSLISGFYDTNIGPKFEAESYKRISQLENMEPVDILFLTDVMKEAQAARSAGCGVGVVLRPGNAKIPEDEIDSFQSFTGMEEIFL